MTDKKHRCAWCGGDALYQHYHDHEWGRPVTDDIRLFEKICLEGFQAGLSWITILKKRENFREAFDGFQYKKIVQYNDDDVQRLLKNSGIIRHHGKIKSVINNAERAIDIEKEFGSLSKYFWDWVPPEDDRPKSFDEKTLKSISYSKTSSALSKDLKKRGWSFVGPTTVYAFMQAMGMINDHAQNCFCREEIEISSKMDIKSAQ